MISLIAALSKQTRAIGKDGGLLFSIPADMARFKALTLGHPVIMGRKTWESIPQKFRPLPERTNIVVTRDSTYEALGADIIHSFEEAITFAQMQEGGAEVWIIGGGELYTLALPHADRLYLTLVNGDVDGDSYFPDYSEFTEVLEEEAHAEHSPSYTFTTLSRPSSNSAL